MCIQQGAKLEDVKLINAIMADYEFYYSLKCEESNIYWAGYSKKPDYNNFKDWYKNNVINNKISFYFISCNNEKVGAIYYKMIDENHCNYLGLAVAERVKGRGIATLAVIKFLEHIRNTKPNCKLIEFYIRFDNIASQKIHAKLGCFKTGKTEEIYLESEGKSVMMEFWKYLL